MNDPNLTGSSFNYDWAYFNPIYNGGNKSHLWRTLTKTEWTYLFNTRGATTINGTANARYTKAQVNNIYGVILFPDTYIHPVALPVPTGINSTAGTGWDVNIYTSYEWILMEANGAVFLPAAGGRFSQGILDTGVSGWYWSSSYWDAMVACNVSFDRGGLNVSASFALRCLGFSVRPVRDNN